MRLGYEENRYKIPLPMIIMLFNISAVFKRQQKSEIINRSSESLDLNSDGIFV